MSPRVLQFLIAFALVFAAAYRLSADWVVALGACACLWVLMPWEPSR